MKYFAGSLIFLLIMGIQSSGQKGGAASGAFDKEGHRGCRGWMPENTIPAMLKAIDLGATTLEMDIVITKDNKVIISHEPWMEQDITTKPDGSFITTQSEAMQYNIYQMDYADVKTFDVGMKPHPRFPNQQKMKVVKPLLSDLIDSVENYVRSKNLPKVQYNIETKSLPAGDNKYHPMPAEFVELIMAVIKDKKIEDHVIIQSFDFRSLQYLHEKYPAIKTSMLIEDSEEKDFEGQLKALGFTPTIYSPNQTMVDADLVKLCHEKGMKIIPWTVNEPKDIKKFKKMGVDGLISDFPDLLK